MIQYNHCRRLRILVTGASGILGGHILQALSAVVPKIDLVIFNADLADATSTDNFISHAGHLDQVIHLAAKVAIDEVDEDPALAYAVNVSGTLNLIRSLIKYNRTDHLFFCSSSHVYAPQSFAISEDSELKPPSLYGRTKLFAETITRDLCYKNNIPLCVGRVFSMHDERQVGSFLRPNLVKRLDEEDLSRLFVLHGAQSIRDFLTAEKVARYITRLSLARYCGDINIASGKPMTVEQFASTLTSSELEVIHTGPVNSIYADISKLKNFLEKDRRNDNT
ncbi:NAD(P)-dependent oxidoreductase [Amylibacter sp.]|nr:NAD(P)-dependent oxidoreductase [Amylibacter sp.]